MNTHECYVSLEVAKLLKQASFDWKCKLYFSEFTNATKEAGVFDDRTNKVYGCFDSTIPGIDSPTEDDILRPTLEVAQRWLREVKGYIILVNYHEFLKTFYYSICYTNNTNRYIDDRNDCRNTSFEEAQEAGIKKVLEIILEKGE